MIAGIGTDLAQVSRFAVMLEKRGERLLEKLLSPEERADCRHHGQPARFLAKRFAAKEALGKALGTGIRAPVLMPAISVTHDALGKPLFAFSPELEAWMAQQGVRAHLSLTDEGEYALAFVVLEHT